MSEEQEKSIETLEAKLRNQLTPIYGLADLVILIEDEEGQMKQSLLEIIIDMAHQVNKNKDKIDKLLKKIESQHDEKTIIKTQIELLEKHIVHPKKPGYNRSDILSKIKELKKLL